MARTKEGLVSDLAVYKAYLLEKGVAQLTVASYLSDLQDTIRYLEEQGVDDWASVDKTNLMGYLTSLKEAGHKSSTLNRRVSSLRRFFAFLQREGKVASDPVSLIRVDQTKRLAPRGLEIEESNALIENAPGKGDTKVRNRALLALLVATGARVNEIIDLKLSDLDLDLGVVYLGKKIRRLVPLNEGANQIIGDYIKTKRANRVQPEASATVFLNNRGAPLSRQSVWEIVNQAGKLGQIKGSVTPQRVRDGFAYRLLKHGADLTLVQNLMGHQSILTTQIYLEK